MWVANSNYNGENVFTDNQTEVSYIENKETKTRPIAEAQLGDVLYMTRTEDVYYEYEASSKIFLSQNLF